MAKVKYFNTLILFNISMFRLTKTKHKVFPIIFLSLFWNYNKIVNHCDCFQTHFMKLPPQILQIFKTLNEL